ncbi:hypothetical protein ACOMHN_015706 [Nucella lapillus]
MNFVNLDLPYRTFQMCEVRLQYQGQSLLFVCFYRPPPSKKNKLTPKMFVDDVEDLIDTLVPLPKFTLLGDINLWYDSVSNHYACTLKSKLSDRNLSQLVNVPTQKKGHILDWIITNQPKDIIDLTVVDKQISDHFLISFSLRLCKPWRRTREVTSRKLKDIDLDVFKADVTTSLSIISPDAGDQAAQLNTCLGELLDLHAPLTTRRVTDRTSAPWMTLEIKAAKQERRRTERQWQQTGLTVHRQIYCHERNVVSRMIRDAKRQYVCDKIVGADSSKELFKVSGELLGKTNDVILPSTAAPSDLPGTFNDVILPSTLLPLICRALSMTFVSKIVKIRSEMPGDTDAIETVPFAGSPFTNFEAVGETQVKETISKMSKKSCKLDPLPASLLFECLDELIPVITNVINTSLRTGSVPISFKHALVKTLIKKSNLDPNILNSYRPVSNLPFLSKVLERVVLSQLLAHLERHSLFEEFQSAYRKCHSTETALLRVVNYLLQSVDRGHVAILSLLDLSAAFDTLDHGTLMRRLSATFGCRGTVLDWFKCYLSDRTQSITVNGIESAASALSYGVPQGSVLGLSFLRCTPSLWDLSSKCPQFPITSLQMIHNCRTLLL